MKKTIMLLTLISVIHLSAHNSYLEKNHLYSFIVKKNNPKVRIRFPSEFTRFLNLQVKRSETKKLSVSSNHFLFDVPYYWWDFNGSQIQQSDPYSYSLDSDNWPECTSVTGFTYCEIRAHADTEDSSIPDLATIDAIRYQPL